MVNMVKNVVEEKIIQYSGGKLEMDGVNSGMLYYPFTWT